MTYEEALKCHRNGIDIRLSSNFYPYWPDVYRAGDDLVYTVLCTDKESDDWEARGGFHGWIISLDDCCLDLVNNMITYQEKGLEQL